MYKLRQKLGTSYILDLKNDPDSEIFQDLNGKPVTKIGQFLNCFNSKQGAELIHGFYEDSKAPLINDDNTLMTLEDFIKTYCCDLQWAIAGGFCGTAGTSGTSGTSGTAGTSSTSGTKPPPKSKLLPIPLDLEDSQGVGHFQKWLVDVGLGDQLGPPGVDKKFGPYTSKAWDLYQKFYLDFIKREGQDKKVEDKKSEDFEFDPEMENEPSKIVK